MIARCEICGHALSVHNELGYCWVRNSKWGECGCDSTSSCIAFVSSAAAPKAAP